MARTVNTHVLSWAIVFLLFGYSVKSADICQAFDQRGLILRNHLYFMGSFYILPPNLTYIYQLALFSLDLRTTFQVEGDLSQSFVSNTSALNVPFTGGGAFWGDLNQTFLYTMAGDGTVTVPGKSTIAGYDTDHKIWQNFTVRGGSFNAYDRHYGMYASSFLGGGNQSFLAGGKDGLAGMIIFDSSDPVQPFWQSATHNDIPYFYNPTTQYVRFGDAGILVSVAGSVLESTDQGLTLMRGMDNVQVYDIAAGVWFTILATGDIPPPRTRTCSAVSAAPDDSSFQFTIYGGWDEHEALDDVYVLTMPSFTWIKINTTTQSATSMPRMDHFCTTYQERQMFVIGGKRQLTPSTGNDCGRGYSAIRLLDTSTFTWQTQYPLSNTMYQVPQAVIDVVGGGPTGGAKPASTYSKILGNHLTVFNKTVPRYDPDNPFAESSLSKPSPSSSSASRTSNAASPPPSDSFLTSPTSLLSPGAIAGIVVGSVLGLGLLMTAAWCFLIGQIRHRRRQRGLNSNQALMGATGEAYHQKQPGSGIGPPSICRSAYKNDLRQDVIEARLYEMGERDAAQLDGADNELHELDQRKSRAGWSSSGSYTKKGR